MASIVLSPTLTLFSGAAANQKFCFYEGIVRLSVKGVVTDETPDPAVRINRQVRG